MILTTLDITEHKRTEAKLRESEEHLRIAIEAANLAVWTYDPETNTLLNLASTSTWQGPPYWVTYGYDRDDTSG